MTDTKILQQFTGEEVVALGPLDQLTQHELASRMPAMTADEKGAMLASVQLNPDFVTVILYEGKVLDGWHRLQASIEAGTTPKFFSFVGQAPVDFVIRENLSRRHLNRSQKAMAAVMSRDWAPRGRPRKAAAGGESPSDGERTYTDAEMAVEAGVSASLIQGAKSAYTAGMGEKVLTAKFSVNEALQRIKDQKLKQESGTATHAEDVDPAAQQEDAALDEELPPAARSDSAGIESAMSSLPVTADFRPWAEKVVSELRRRSDNPCERCRWDQLDLLLKEAASMGVPEAQHIAD